MKKSILYLIIQLFAFLSAAQTINVDSLLYIVKSSNSIEEKVKNYGTLSWALIDNDLKQAIAYNDSIFNISKRYNYIDGIADANYRYSVLNRALGDYDKALMFLDEYEKFITGDTLKIANAAFQRGVLNSIKGDYDEGLRSYQIALNHYELLDHKRGIGMIYNTLGITYSNMNQYDESISNYKKSIKILKSVNDIDALASTYSNLANVYKKKNEYDEALDYFNKSIELSTKTSNIRRIAHNKQNISSIYKEQKAYSKAVEVALQAYNILNEHNYKGELTGAAANLGEIYTLMGNYRESEQILKKHLNNLKGSVKDQSKLYFSLYKLYEVSNRHQEALMHHKEYKKLSDSIINENGLKNFNELRVKYDIEKKDKELVEQKLTLEKQELEIQKKKSQYTLMTGIAIFLLLTSLLTWFLYKQRQKRKDQEILSLKREHQIKTLESLIEGEEKERFRIAKELHDGVNGDLSAIKYKLTALLEKNNSVINEAVAMIDKSCEQVRAISHNLIPPSLKNFSLLEALEDYCSTMNGIHKPEITFQHIGDSIAISKTAEVNIFRIIQELINNSIKYADATEIDAQISNRDNVVQITVEDNGKGFNINNVSENGIGLKNIQSRVDYLNGKLDFSSTEEGSSFIIEINLNQLNDN
ncbi:sensor histidine kinase [Flaviramulus sp. BrNp1-15]|uniref:tetratricopeptide repeat-containing sensor histidine kinase n=1 Tax=Flaviramulus sp. BrNp1-15 TaxID=2916754 RepID=UPI001EE95175|nr:tetratricopeptide repeat protein [Flaviramulus sp. BrNp1-15]ULC58808.1 sensor histidine kinase [Flaviramulus sp. BrNp1-15]